MRSPVDSGGGPLTKRIGGQNNARAITDAMKFDAPELYQFINRQHIVIYIIIRDIQPKTVINVLALVQ